MFRNMIPQSPKGEIEVCVLYTLPYPVFLTHSLSFLFPLSYYHSFSQLKLNVIVLIAYNS